MEDFEEEESKGKTLGEIFKTIFSQKWLALIIAAAITLVGSLGLILLYNPAQKSYEMVFTVVLPNTDDNSPATYTYPDGTLFRYTDIISYKNLSAVKESNPAYKDVDVAKMSEKGAISITREITEAESTAVNVYDLMYKVTVASSYFDSTSTARNFLYDLAYVPANYVKTMEIEYDRYLSALEMAEDLTYDVELNFLANQLSYIRDWYNTLIEEYNANFVVENGKTLDMYRSEVEVYTYSGITGTSGSISIFDRLKEEARTKKYIKSEELKDVYAIQLSDLERKLEREQFILDTLKGTAGIVETDTVVRTQAELVKQLEQDKVDLTNYISSGSVNAEFDAKVQDVKEKISSFTEDFTTAITSVYAKATTVSFYNPQVVTVSGGMGTMMSVILSLVIGIVVALIVAYIVGRVRSKKPEENTAAAPAPVLGQAEAQAAATQDEEKKD